MCRLIPGDEPDEGMQGAFPHFPRGCYFWLFFACELKKQVEELRGHGITRYCFTGRKECVMALRGRKRWDRSCQSLLEDLDFLLSRYEEQAADC